MQRSELLRRLRARQIIAGELPATAPNRTAWIGIYPLDPARAETSNIVRRSGLSGVIGDPLVTRVRLFEIADELRETYFGESDMGAKRDFVVVGEEPLLEKLAELDVALDILNLPSIVNYPL